MKFTISNRKKRETCTAACYFSKLKKILTNSNLSSRYHPNIRASASCWTLEVSEQGKSAQFSAGFIMPKI